MEKFLATVQAWVAALSKGWLREKAEKLLGLTSLEDRFEDGSYLLEAAGLIARFQPAMGEEVATLVRSLPREMLERLERHAVCTLDRVYRDLEDLRAGISSGSIDPQGLYVLNKTPYLLEQRDALEGVRSLLRAANCSRFLDPNLELFDRNNAVVPGMIQPGRIIPGDQLRESIVRRLEGWWIIQPTEAAPAEKSMP